MIVAAAASSIVCFADDVKVFEKPDVGFPGSSHSEEIPDWLARWELARCLTILKRYDEAIVDYRLVVDAKPDLHEARLELAQVLVWHDRKTEASGLLEEIKTDSLTVGDIALLADIHKILEQYDLAAPLYRAVLDAKPDDHQTRLKLAEMLSWQKKYEESLSEYRTLLEALPQDTQVRRKYAMVLIWAGKHEEAIPELRQTLP